TTLRMWPARPTYRATTPLSPGAAIFYFHSQPGDYIGQGQQRALHAGTGYVIGPATGTIAGRNIQNGISLTIQGGGDSWTLDLAGPQRAPLAVGSYENAVRFPFNHGPNPGINLSGQGRGCNTIQGRF